MNFNSAASSTNMPELDWQFGYIMVWGIIAVMIGGMLYFFRRKKWI